jgi:hypothetical protein
MIIETFVVVMPALSGHLLYNIAKKKGQSLKAFALHSSLFKCGIDDY